MYVFLLVLHLFICLGLVGAVLIQSGKGGGLAGGAFGGSAQTVFGGKGATDFITNATMVLGAAFFVSSLVLALMSSGQSRPGRSLIQGEARRAAATAPPPAAGQKPGSQLPAIPAPRGGATPAPSGPAKPTTTKPGGGGP